MGNGIGPVAPICLQALAQMLVEVCKNPKNPGFNHYLFESVAALIKHAADGNAAMIETFEQMLFPAFNLVLQQVGACGFCMCCVRLLCFCAAVVNWGLGCAASNHALFLRLVPGA